MFKAARENSSECGRFWQAAFLIKQAIPSSDSPSTSPRSMLICYDCPPHIRNHLHQVFDSQRQPNSQAIGDTVVDPYRILLIIFIGWFHWNSELFWVVRDNLRDVESINRRNILSETSDSDLMHFLAKDMIQAVEMFQVALNTVKTAHRIHSSFLTKGEDKSEILEQTHFALDYHRIRYENLLDRTTALLKRMDFQLSLVGRPLIHFVAFASWLMRPDRNST